jgi:type II secretory pathway component PulC
MADRLSRNSRGTFPARAFSFATLFLWILTIGMIAWYSSALARTGVEEPEDIISGSRNAAPPAAWEGNLRLQSSPDPYLRGLPIEILAGESSSEESAPSISDLQVTVLGTDLVLQPNGAVEEAFAIIRNDQTMNIGVYAVGQSISDAVILRIQPNEVLVRREDGRQEILRFLDQSSTPRQQRREDGNSPSEPVLEQGRAAQIVYPANKFRRQIDREKALEYINEVFSDLSTVSAYASGFKPVLEGDQLQGFMLGKTLPGDMLQATGLQAGDIIRRVNSLELDSTSKIDYFYDEFSGNRLHAIVLDVERSGVRTNLVYTVK